MTRFWLFLVVFLLILTVFRMANGAEFIGLSEILIKLETVEFDMSPLIDLFEFFEVTSESDGIGVGIGGASGSSGSRPGIGVGIGGASGSRPGVGVSSIEDFINSLSEKIDDFFASYIEFFEISVRILWLPFDLLFQVLDVALWMLGFTA